ncbi:hypothetical protein MNB_ARC-1_2 [hydrothermal vent metagenome]|uniref:Uncharacterized protein n=1 Tax=hydrothermal vent metagenome TaxID=652676 RepID=A0A3B1DXQ9_9ZZZZ
MIISLIAIFSKTSLCKGEDIVTSVLDFHSRKSSFHALRDFEVAKGFEPKRADTVSDIEDNCSIVPCGKSEITAEKLISSG